MAATYEPIATTTLSSTASDVSFTSISGSYTDLVLIATIKATSTFNVRMQFNSDTGSNYSFTYVLGDGSGTESGRSSNAVSLDTGGVNTDKFGVLTYSIQNYSNSTTYKTVVNRSSEASKFTAAYVGLWRSTSAITTIKLFPTTSTFASGSTFTLYGIKAAV